MFQHFLIKKWLPDQDTKYRKTRLVEIYAQKKFTFEKFTFKLNAKKIKTFTNENFKKVFSSKLRASQAISVFHVKD